MTKQADQFDPFDQYVPEPTQRMGEPTHGEMMRAIHQLLENQAAICERLEKIEASLHEAGTRREQQSKQLAIMERTLRALNAWKDSIGAVSRQ